MALEAANKTGFEAPGGANPLMLIVSKSDTGDAEAAAEMERMLDSEARDRLRVFRAFDSENTPLYLILLEIFATAKSRYKVQLSTRDVMHALSERGYDTAALPVETALDQLVDWGSLLRDQDTSKVSSLEEFKRKRSIYQLSTVGQISHESAYNVITAAAEQGSLQKVMLSAILDDLRALAAELAEPTPSATVVFRTLNSLSNNFENLTRNASDFHNMIARVRKSNEEQDEEHFIAYKSMLLSYLESFLGKLDRTKVQIARAIRAVEEQGVLRMCDLAASLDDTPTLEEADRATEWVARWNGIANWFVSDGFTQSGVAGLENATRTAITDLMIVLKRIYDSQHRRITRVGDLVALSRFFRDCESQEAADRLFAVSFGLWSCRHLGGIDEDAEDTSPLTSWWDANPALVPTLLREPSKRVEHSWSPKAENHEMNKSALIAKQRERMRAQAEAVSRLVANPGKLTGGVLDRWEANIVRGLFTRARHLPSTNGIWKAKSADGRLTLIVQPGKATEIRTEEGTLTLYGNAILETR